jgi:CelD/BcsL family acetyltransferase involved in cellulose biosynthesis
MRATAIPWSELCSDVELRWTELQRKNPALTSPYFYPTFASIVAQVQDNAELAVIEEDNKIVALLPFQRMLGGVGVPIGHFMSDYHGLICEPSFHCDPRELMKQCRLVAWDFDHLIASQRCFAPFHREVDPSPQIDLSNGFDDYRREKSCVKTEQIKIRKIERECGSLRFVPHSDDQAALHQLLTWKSQQYIRTGKQDIFTLPWTTSILREVHKIQDRYFAGMLSGLYAGDRLVALHFGMRSDSLLHSWFPAYDPQMAHYSPGLILLLKIAEHARSLGINTIDLGKGMYEHKQRFMNASVALASGSVELASWLHTRRALRRNLRWLAERLHVDQPARTLFRALLRRKRSLSNRR